MKRFLRKIVKRKEKNLIPKFPDMEPEIVNIMNSVKEFTMTSYERLYSFCKSIEYIIHNNLQGDIVECGVWKGGSMMAAALMLNKMKDNSRSLYLYDTFEGMTKPTIEDIEYYKKSPVPTFEYWQNNHKGNHNEWCFATLETVKKNLFSTKYDSHKLFFIKGDVLETIPKFKPKQIAILRLDTDWYKSTLHELEHLYPLLINGGVLIIDDYGHWQGAKKAVDEFLIKEKDKIFLSRIDYTCRLGIKIN